MTAERPDQLFSALLRYWRGRRGLSQLDLALAADVSARHVSFLETSRAMPSEDMVLRLAGTLEVPLREQNDMLEAAGFARRFAEPRLEELLAGPIGQLLDRMLSHHEPFPMMLLNEQYDLLRANRAASKLLEAFAAEPEALGTSPNVIDVLFNPRLVRPFVADWERTARTMLSRLHREALNRRPSAQLANLLDQVLAYPDVPVGWREPDFSVRPEPALSIHLERGRLSVALMSTVTVIRSPMNVTLEELQIESFFPLDEESDATCRRLGGA